MHPLSVAFGRSSRLFGSQHDPDDEPVAPPLDPEFFEFDRQWFPRPSFPASNRTRFSHSAQGRYQPRAAQRTAVRGDHDFQPAPHDIMSSGSSPRSLFYFIVKLNCKRISQDVPSILFTSRNSHFLFVAHLRCCLYRGLRWPRGSTILESQSVLPEPVIGWPRKQEFPNARLRLCTYFRKTTHAPRTL